MSSLRVIARRNDEVIQKDSLVIWIASLAMMRGVFAFYRLSLKYCVILVIRCALSMP